MEKTKLSPDQADLARRWVKALRSGEYKQATGGLRSEAGGFCCLGVLCDVVDPSQWEPDGLWFRYRGNRGSPPKEVPSLLPFSWSLDRGVEIAELISRNDDWGWTFDQIADYIESLWDLDCPEGC